MLRFTLVWLTLALAVAGALAADAPSFTNGDFAAGMQGWWTNPKELVTPEVVEATAPGFAKALKLTLTLKGDSKPHNAMMGRAIAGPIAQGERLRLRAWLRSPQQCMITMKGQLLQAPYTGIFSETTVLTPHWSEFAYEGIAPRDYADGEAGIVIFLGHHSGVIEMTGFRIEKLGQTPVERAPFPFVIPLGEATKTGVDVSDLNPAPLAAPHRISVKGEHFYDTTGRRVRFVGANITAGGCFPPKEQAEIIAARLHKYGFNAVRLHHMDASWAQPNLFYLTGGSYKRPTLALSPESLDRLDYLVYQLKQHGIYVDLNLHVSREWSEANGFPEGSRLPELGKVAAYFEPKAITQQQEIARQLLEHVNPYTKQRYADDPVVALIELNNEDSLVGSADSLLALPAQYRETLAKGWNAYLTKTYGTTDKLLAAWNAEAEPLEANLLTNPRFADGVKGYVLERQGTASYTAEAEAIAPAPGAPAGNALHLGNLKLDGTNWHLQFHQVGLNLQDGKRYTVTFSAKATANRVLPVGVRLDQAPWSTCGLDARVEVTPQWQRYQMEFVATGVVPNHCRLSFMLGDVATDLYLAELSVQPGGGGVSLAAGERLETATIPLMRVIDLPAGRDMVRYLMQVEADYVTALRQTIRATGSTAAVTCSQASYGGVAGIYREAQTDWVDMHAYWQHPNFPNKPWDANDYRIPNTSMLRDSGIGTLGGLAMHRVAGKPFTVSEYDHAAPSEYAAEMVPTIFSYAAWQDWDGIFLFDYPVSDRDRIGSFFDNAAHPGKLAFVPSMARAFQTGALQPAQGQMALTIPTGEIAGLTARKTNNSFWNAATNVKPTAADFMFNQAAVDFTTLIQPVNLAISRKRTKDTSEFLWDRERQTLTVDTATLLTLAGQVGGTAQQGKYATVTFPSTARNFGVLTLVAMDGKPMDTSGRLLLTAMEKAENTGMSWNENRTFAWNSWGKGPTQVWALPATVEIKTTAKAVTVYVLDSTGARKGTVPTTLKDGVLTFTIGSKDQTVWYEVVGE